MTPHSRTEKARAVDSPHGRVKVFMIAFGRNGRLDDIYYEYGGRLISHFERRVRGWSGPDMQALLDLCYPASMIRAAIRTESPLLKMIPKDDTWVGGGYVQVPFT